MTIDPHAEGRPARRYFRPTPTCASQAFAALAGARRPTRTALRGQAGGSGTEYQAGLGARWSPGQLAVPKGVPGDPVPGQDQVMWTCGATVRISHCRNAPREAYRIAPKGRLALSQLHRECPGSGAVILAPSWNRSGLCKRSVAAPATR